VVASSISKNYYDLDPEKVLELADIIYAYNKKMERRKFEKASLEKYHVQTVPELDSFIKNN